jgi:ribosomal protein S18 acetylase RimI-like enzyme
MQSFRIRAAGGPDLPALDAGLRALSAETGDTHRASPEALQAGLFGPAACSHALLAEGDATLIGLGLFTPLFSTTRGGAGVYLSDLWVAPDARGNGIGAALLAAVARDAHDRWRAGFMRLAVHDDNAAARRLYERLGFGPVAGETGLVLASETFERCRRRP